MSSSQYHNARKIPYNCSDYISKPTFTQIFLASSLGLVIAAAVHYHFKKLKDRKIVPCLIDSGRREKCERFPHYVGKHKI